MASQNDDYELTFSQREGLAPLPEALQLGALPKDFRNAVWFFIERSIISAQRSSLFRDSYWRTFGLSFIVTVLNKPHDSMSLVGYDELCLLLRRIILNQKYNETLDLLEHMLRHQLISFELKADIEACFARAPYIVNRSDADVCIVSVTSNENKQSLTNALNAINQSGLTDAKIHLAASAEALNNQQFSDSIRESVHAVEAAARYIAPDAKDKTLGAALQILKDRDIINHKMLKATFEKLYAYANDASGIRHSQKGGEPENVGIDEALFIYSACVSFVDYLVRKQSQLNNDA